MTLPNDATLIDPFAVAVVARAVERENVRRMLIGSQLDRVQHFEQRIAALLMDPAEYLIVVLNVNDRNGADLANVLMPGHDWPAIHARGETPFARGLVERWPLQHALGAGSSAGAELAAVAGIAVLAVDRGIATAFSLSELLEMT